MTPLPQKTVFHALLLLSLLNFYIKQTSAWSIPLPNGGKISFNDGILRVGLEDRSKLPDMPPCDKMVSKRIMDSIQIRDTGTLKGFGAYCKSPLDRHEFLGFYEGERISGLQGRLSQDYIVSLDGGMTFLDGYEPAQNRVRFTPAHLNHADKGQDACNCLRILEDGRVAFFTARSIDVGEELCFDYGSNYWAGREAEKI